jgi:predicted amidohydrolase
VKLAALALSVTLMAASAAAHHSAAATYDATRSLPITGIVASFAWTNPHSHLYVGVTDGPFRGQEYVIEMSSPGVLTEAGWSPATIKAGDRVTVHVFPSRSGAAIGLCRKCLVTVNGVTKPRTVG